LSALVNTSSTTRRDMKKLFVNVERHLVVNEYSDEEYGDYEKVWECDVSSVTLSRQKGHWNLDREEFPVSYPVAAGDVVHVLYMIYTTGDSFGHESGLLDVLYVFSDEDLVKHATNEVRAQEREYTIEVEVEGGKTLTLYNLGSGDFDSVTLVDYESFTVEP
jgi:hypothetical protein